MKSINEIYEALLADAAARSGTVVEDSCDLAVRLYAAAAQIQALYIQADWVLDQSFPQTAQGVYLDRHAAMRGVSRVAAVRAIGTVRFFVETVLGADLTVPAGTVCMTAEGLRFQTTEAAVVEAGALSADAAAEAVEPGASSNAAAGTVGLLTACPVSVTRCTNPAAFSGGADAEGDDALRARVLESYRRLPDGANAAWYERTAMSHTGVVSARAVGRRRGIGTVDVYVATEAGLPTAALVEEVRADLQNKREIAVDVAVLAPETAVVNIAAEIKPQAGADAAAVCRQAEMAVQAMFGGRLLGEAVRLAEVSSRIYALDDVENVHLLSPSADLAGASGVLPVMGTLTVTQMGA